MRQLVQWKAGVVDLRNMDEKNHTPETATLLRVARSKVRKIEFMRGIVTAVILVGLMACQGCGTIAGIGEDIAWGAQRTEQAIRDID